MRKTPSHWYLGDLRGSSNTVMYGILTSLPVYSGSCLQTHWQVISIENQTYLIIGLMVLMVDSGGKAHSLLRTVFDIVWFPNVNNSNSQLR